jgi:glycine dehydrogenase subunit 1
VPRWGDPQRRSVIETYCQPAGTTGHICVIPVDTDPENGTLAMDDLQAKLGPDVAAVYVETPNFLGVIEPDIAEICARARAAGAFSVVGVDPVSLGVLSAPGDYGADIATGPTQPLGIHMNGGGGTGGFIATADDERLAREYPTLQVSLVPTIVSGERGFSLTLFEQSSYGAREDGKDWTGNSVYLWAVVNAVYMSLLGPEGFRELGQLILRNSHRAREQIARVPGVTLPFQSACFKEFAVCFDATGLTVDEVNRRLRSRGIYGGYDLSRSHPWLGQSALYCVTEVHTHGDVDRLVSALEEVVVA